MERAQPDPPGSTPPLQLGLLPLAVALEVLLLLVEVLDLGLQVALLVGPASGGQCRQRMPVRRGSQIHCARRRLEIAELALVIRLRLVELSLLLLHPPLRRHGRGAGIVNAADG